MKIVATTRGKKANRRLDLTDLRVALDDKKQWVLFGTVFKPDGAKSHYELVEEDGQIVDVLVEVQSIDLLDPTCRLSCMAGGPGAGLWRVPDVGTEVAVMLPAGAIDFMPIIIGILSTGAVPARVGMDKTVLVAPDAIEVTAPRVVLGPNPEDIVDQLDGLVHGRGVDSFTGMRYANLGNASTHVLGNKGGI